MVSKAIGFLADLIGLHGIADKIADIVAALQKHVTEAIDWLIDLVMKRDDKDNADTDDGGNAQQTPRTISGAFGRFGR